MVLNIPDDIKEKLKEDGFAVIRSFITPERADDLKKEAEMLILNMPSQAERIRFSTTETEHHQNEYYLKTADRIGYFFEAHVLKPNGELAVDPILAVNKIGHGIHKENENFRKYTYSEDVKKLIRKLGYEDPIVVQSMLNFKNPKIGSIVAPHQDATYLYSEPQKLVGLFVALEDAVEENGCLRCLKGSHKQGVFRRLVRNPDKNAKDIVIFDKPLRNFNLRRFIPIECKKGDLILIDGNCVHYSEPNTSDRSRYAYIFHVLENKGVEWSKENWLQPPAGFEHLYETSC